MKTAIIILLIWAIALFALLYFLDLIPHFNEGKTMKAKDLDNFEELLDTAETNAITDWDMDFASDMKDKYQLYGKETNVSESQLEQLERIAGQ